VVGKFLSVHAARLSPTSEETDMSQPAVLSSVDARGVATVTLNRPEVNNAYDETLIQGLHDAMDELGAKPELRVVVLRGAGKHFQAGADLKWIRRVASQDALENERVSRATAMAVHRLNTLPVPTVALVQGGCFGGGTGIAPPATWWSRPTTQCSRSPRRAGD
jgi:methylglutaconyl-CoA hydratase